ncbi:MAG TPA: VOC family protein [Syntrophales bacterium]|nr:VOC family protein [Syntrophales bacterium]HPN26176.1 VOC family protein [Syntrophales bacterium]HQM30433.1 VOC family protein [Syntrophales bacterium]
MIRRIDHVSIAVRDLARARSFFVDALGGRVLYTGPMPEEKYRWTTIELGTSCLLELIDPLGEDGFVDEFLKKRGEGLHHVTIQVHNLEDACRTLESRGVPVFGMRQPIAGWKEAYIHPKHAFGVLIQLAEFNPLDWIEPGYIPAAYREFAPPGTAGAEEGPLKVQQVETEKGVQVEIRKGGRALRIPKRDLGRLIAALEGARSTAWPP